METQASKMPMLAWIAAISLIVSCGAGVGVMMGWIPTSLGKPDAPVLTKLEQPVRQAKHVPAPAFATTRCTECGVVQSVREVKIKKRANSTRSYEITVDFDDGTNRVITEASAPTWRNGDKVRIVNGVIESNA